MLFSKISELILGWSQDFPKEINLPGLGAFCLVPMWLPLITPHPLERWWWNIIFSFWRRDADWDTTTVMQGLFSVLSILFPGLLAGRKKRKKRERRECNLPSFADQLYSQNNLFQIRALICKRQCAGNQTWDLFSALTFSIPCCLHGDSLLTSLQHLPPLVSI